MNTQSTSYEKEFLALRYAVMCQSNDSKTKAEGYTRLINYAKKAKWVYLQDELIRSARNESSVSQQIGNVIMDSLVDPTQLQQLEDVDSFFIKLNPKDAYNQSNKIKEYAIMYFNKGNFSQYNNIFSRYIKNMRDLNDSEMNDFIIRFFVSSVIKKNYEIAISDISVLRSNYLQYDLNFYIYLLRMINGNFIEAADTVLNVKQNIYDEAWKIVSESDLAFYFTLSLLICFKRHVLKEVQMLSQSMIYRFFEDFPHYIELLENYSKCRFDIITEEVEKLQEKIHTDPLTANNFTKINFEIKNNILKEILKSCSSVSIAYLSSILREKDTQKIENWIFMGISEGYLQVRIDDIDKTVYAQEISTMRNSVQKTLEFSKSTYNNSINKILGNIGVRTVDLRDVELDEFKKYPIEKHKGRGHMDPESEAAMMIDYY